MLLWLTLQCHRAKLVGASQQSGICQEAILHGVKKLNTGDDVPEKVTSSFSLEEA